jgi:PAS domain S-box-containing protein
MRSGRPRTKDRGLCADELILTGLEADERGVTVIVGRLLGAAVAALGVVSLVGWALEREPLTRLVGGSASLKVNTAICFALLGWAVVVDGRERQRVRTVLEVAAGAIAVATLFEHLHGSLGIDELLLDDPFTTAGAPGRMSIGSALALALVAGGMLGLDSLRREVRLAAHLPLIVGGGIGLVGLIGYASGLEDLYWGATMALDTAAGLLVLGVAAFAVAPLEGILAILSRPSPGGRLLRRLVPAAVLAPAAFLVPIGRGADLGLYGFDVGMLLFLIATVGVSLPLLFWTARSLDAAETRARADAERFESVLRAATEHPIIGIDTTGTITFFSEGAERMLGYRAEEVVGRATPTLIHDPAELAARAAELGVAPGFEALVAAAREDRAEAREWTYLHKDGTRVPVSLTVTATHDPDGTEAGFIGMAFDLSARRELERELRRQAEFTGTLVGSAPVGIYAVDREGSCIFVNAKWQELAGRTEEEALGDGWKQAVHPGDAEGVMRAWEAFTTGKAHFAAEFRLQRPSGSRVWVAGQAVTLRDHDGEPRGYLGTILDVTQRREAQAQRERLLAESRAVLDATTDGILMTGLEGDVLFSNAAMSAFWQDVGLAGEGTIWDRVAELADLITDPATYYRLLEAVALDPEEEHVGEFTLAASGRSFVGRTAPVRRADGGLMGRIFSLRDTTTERAAARAKDEFVATVSHELRTPLAAITGYAELLEDDVPELGEESAQFLAVLQRNAARLTQLVDDLLLLQQSEADGVTIGRDAVDVDDLVRQSVERVEPTASRKAIDVDTLGDRGLVVQGDAMRLGQVLDSLLSNAVKFTPDGGAVEVRVSRVGGACAVDVHDSGPGIPEDERGRLFERFFRSRDAVARAIPGTGLGLAVSRRIAEAHGGSLGLADADAGGATFRLLLPGPVTVRPGELRLLKSPARGADTPFE